MHNKLIVVDLDDTLMWNSYTYGIAMQKFYSFLLNLWDNRVPALGSIAAFSEDIDAKLGKEINPKTNAPYGFCMERYPTSLVDTYKHLCEMGFGEFDTDVAKKVYNIGLSAFDKEQYIETGLVPGAYKFLETLSLEEKNALVLLTKGDERVQTPKIEALNLYQWFDECIIVDSKTPELFMEIRENYLSENCYSVGNSFYSDIEPALKAGYRGLFVPCYTWKVEKVPEDYPQDTVITVQNISQALEFLREEPF